MQPILMIRKTETHLKETSHMNSTQPSLNFDSLEKSTKDYQEKLLQIKSNKEKAEDLRNQIQSLKTKLAEMSESQMDQALHTIAANSNSLELLDGREAPYRAQLERMELAMRRELVAACQSYEEFCRAELEKVKLSLTKVLEPLFGPSFINQLQYCKAFNFVVGEIKFANNAPTLSIASGPDSVLSLALALFQTQSWVAKSGTMLSPDLVAPLKDFSLTR